MENENYFNSTNAATKWFARQELPSAATSVLDAAAADYMEQGIDLNEQLIRNKPSTFFFRMKGDAMQDAGIFDGDLLIVDQSVKPTNGKIIVAVLNGELMVRRFHKNFTSSFLIPENNRYKPINLGEFSDILMWGVVIYVIKSV